MCIHKMSSGICNYPPSLGIKVAKANVKAGVKGAKAGRNGAKAV